MPNEGTGAPVENWGTHADRKCGVLHSVSIEKPVGRLSPGQAQVVRLPKKLLSGKAHGSMVPHPRLCTCCERAEVLGQPLSPAMFLQHILLRRLKEHHAHCEEETHRGGSPPIMAEHILKIKSRAERQ